MNVEIRDERFRQVIGYDAPVEELVGGFDFTEGAVWNHVEGCLIFSDMSGNVMRKWTAADGIKVFRQPSNRDGLADGMKIDTQGNLYTAGPGGVHVFAPDATCLGVIDVPQGVANFTWGDADLRSLFITAGTSLYRTRLNVPGRKLF